MSESSVLKIIAQHKLIPVIVCDQPSRAEPLADALMYGGLPVAEVTLRTPDALDAIGEMAKVEGVLTGAGTVLSAEQAEQALDRGAAFLVSPGYDEGVVAVGRERGVPVIPGIATATELQRAVNQGVKLVKFFPAEAIGGLPLLKAIAGPFPDVQFVPTGGISTENVKQYLAHPAVVACGGSWMVRRDWIQNEEWASLTNCVRQAVAHVADE